jgi:hypothetical protein
MAGVIEGEAEKDDDNGIRKCARGRADGKL